MKERLVLGKEGERTCKYFSMYLIKKGESTYTYSNGCLSETDSIKAALSRTSIKLTHLL